MKRSRGALGCCRTFSAINQLTNHALFSTIDNWQECIQGRPHFRGDWRCALLDGDFGFGAVGSLKCYDPIFIGIFPASSFPFLLVAG